jgi:23S rRNA pseudouridine1911/1915/1917 synthase
MNKVKEINICADDANARIDKFLKREVFFNDGITRGEIVRAIKEEKILVNQKAVKASYILKLGDQIFVDWEREEPQVVPNDNIAIEVIFQNENIIVIEKPAGLQVHPDHLEKNRTLINGVLANFPEISEVGDEPNVRPGIVHRLDKDTSGVMVVARNQKAFLELKSKFKNREIEKKYWALVYGILEEKEGVIEKPIARSADYKRQVIAGKKTKTKIRSAITIYSVIQEFEGFSLVEVSPKTGRMHQIRVHMTSIGHPIVGDKKYILKGMEPLDAAKRQMLHAKTLSFELFGGKYSFSMELPEDFQSIIKNLTKLQEKDSIN